MSDVRDIDSQTIFWVPAACSQCEACVALFSEMPARGVYFKSMRVRAFSDLLARGV